MKLKVNLRLIPWAAAPCLLMLSSLSQATTTLVSTSKYSVTEGVAFSIGSSGVSNFLFSWTDPTGLPPLTSTGVVDPTLVLTIGQSYTFTRTSSSHPFAIMSNSAASFIFGTDGVYQRSSFAQSDIDTAILSPAVNFIANPAISTNNLITWVPDQVGDFWYTCTVPSHPGMTGKITVVPEPSALCIGAVGVAFATLRRRRTAKA